MKGDEVADRVETSRTRVGEVSAYVGGAGIEVVRQAREQVGRVTVSGKKGLKVLRELAHSGDLHEIDYDPAEYLDLHPEDTLFEADRTAEQRSLGLPVIRSAGR